MIEELRSEEIKEAAEIYMKTIQMMSPPAYITMEKAIQDLQKNFVHRKWKVFVSKDEKTKAINGIIIFRIIDKRIKLFFIGVFPTRKGIGTKLMKRLGEFAVSQGSELIITDVSGHDERAMSFYFERCKFKKIKEYRAEQGFKKYDIKADAKDLVNLEEK